MPEFYEDGQVRNIFPYVPLNVDWFIIGGPADGNEAQVFKKNYPNCMVLGFEPNPKMYQFQLEHEFLGVLESKALWSDQRTIDFGIPEGRQRCGSFKHTDTSEQYRIETCSLDYFFFQEPIWSIKNAVLWIDIERSELECLKGAKRLLTDKRIATINVEVMTDTIEEISDYLNKMNYKLKIRWNIRHLDSNRTVCDCVYVR